MASRQTLFALAALSALGACGTLPASVTGGDSALELRLAEAEARNDALAREVAELRSAGAPGAPVMPEGVEAGRCYAWIGALDGTAAAERVLLEPEREVVRITPAIYEMVEERILVREARTEYVVTPAVVETVVENVLVSEGYTERTVMPALYEEQAVSVPAREAYVAFEACATPGDPNALCAREEPARRGEATRRVMTQPERVRELEIPARYMRVRRELVREPAKLVVREIPAEYETIQVQRLVRPSSEQTVTTPAVYAQAEAAPAPGPAGWVEVLCDTPENRSVVRDVQRALAREGHDPGPADGLFGPRTRAALVAWQRDAGLPQGHLTRATAERLGLAWKP
jgi:hypothetical protein